MRFWILACFCCIVFTTAETIHFTNSPSHLIGSKNLTRYKVHMKNSNPITIVEASKEVSSKSSSSEQSGATQRENDRIDLDEKTSDEKQIISRFGASQQTNKEKVQKIYGSVGLTIDTSSNDTYNENTSNGVGIKRLVYSPILLKKFVSEYMDKWKNADSKTKSEIEEIHDKIKNHATDKSNEFDGPSSKISENIPEEKWFSLFASDERRPFDADRNSAPWTSMDAVPWSVSTVKKWHPNKVQSDHRRPYPFYTRPNKYHHDEFSNDEDDFFKRRKPSNIDRNSQRPSVVSLWTKPQSFQRPQTDFDDSDDSDSFRNKFYDRFSSSSRPWQNDIITDDRAPDFPDSSIDSTDDHQHIHHHYQTYDDIDRNHSPSNHHHSVHTLNGPESGNGEWVLISSTKGYQAPQNYRQYNKRAMAMSGTIPQHILHKSVKLTVLPALKTDRRKNTTSSIQNNRHKKPNVISSHDGLLEVQSGYQTVDEDAAQMHKNQQKRRRKFIKGKIELKM